jgi:hypothetical protein
LRFHVGHHIEFKRAGVWDLPSQDLFFGQVITLTCKAKCLKSLIFCFFWFFSSWRNRVCVIASSVSTVPVYYTDQFSRWRLFNEWLVSVSNNFFICQRILPHFFVDFVFILLCTFLEVDLVFFSCNVCEKAISGFRDGVISNFIRYRLTECKQCWLHRMFRDHVHLWITLLFVTNTCVSLDITKTSPEDHAKLSAFHALRLRFTICVLIAWAGVLLVWKKYIDKRNI